MERIELDIPDVFVWTNNKAREELQTDTTPSVSPASTNPHNKHDSSPGREDILAFFSGE